MYTLTKVMGLCGRYIQLVIVAAERLRTAKRMDVHQFLLHPKTIENMARGLSHGIDNNFASDL